MEKKYVLKQENINSLSADGTENSEHIFDMIDRAEMCLNNIQDNTDLCMNVFKLSTSKVDEDESDAMQLMCEDCIEIERQAGEITDKIQIIKSKIDKHLKVKEMDVEELLKQILILELHSKQIAEKILQN